MNRTICQECGAAISNEFGVTLSFCTNCGASLRLFNSAEALTPGEIKIKTEKPKNHLLRGIIAGAFLMLFLLGGIYLTYNHFSHKETASSDSAPFTIPFIDLPKFNSVAASDITEISVSSWRHKGLLNSGDGFVESKSITFRRDGSAVQTQGKNYDDGKTPDRSIETKSSITKEQFERLAASVVENVFFNQADSKERISEGDNSLVVKFSGTQKEIKTSNINKDTPEIEKILGDIKSLEMNLMWSPAK